MKEYIDLNKPLMDRKEVCKATLKSKSQLQLDVKSGLFPPQITIGGRKTAYITKEVNAVISMWVAGVSKEKLKDAVTDMVNDRK